MTAGGISFRKLGFHKCTVENGSVELGHEENRITFIEFPKASYTPEKPSSSGVAIPVTYYSILTT